MSAKETQLIFDSIYLWHGNFGAWFSSFERGVRVGDVRFVRGRLFTVYSAQSVAFHYRRRLFLDRGKKDCWWVPVEVLGNDDIAMREKFRTAL